MFEFLYNVDADKALGGVHFALRRITHRQTSATPHKGDVLIESDSPIDGELGLKVLGEIERTEHLPLSSLSPERAYYYKNLLASLAQNLAMQTFPYDKEIGSDLLKGWRKEGLQNVSTISVPSLPLSAGKLRLLGAYLLLGMLAAAYFTYALWPRVSANTEVMLIPRLLRIAVSPDTRLLLLAMVTGALGSLIHTSRSFAWYVGNRKLSNNWIWWYLTQPFVGMLLALVFYFVIRGGFLSATATVEDVNVFAVAAVSGLVGMFSSNALQKLEEVFVVLFSSAKTNELPEIGSNGSRLKKD